MLCPAHSRLRYIFVMLIIIGIPFIGGCTDRDNSEEIRIMREWANLAPLPETADLNVETKGNAATREFVIAFTAKGDDIKEWIAKSPGTRDISPTKNDKGELAYRIKPASEAQFAEVTISADGLRVKIRTYWS